MKKLFPLTLALASLTALMSAQSPPPPPAPAATSQEQQEIRGDENGQSTPSNTPSQIAASSIYQQTPAPTAQASEPPCCQSSKESSFDYNALAVTLFTAALVVLAYRQWRAARKQARYMKESVWLTSRAADAAQKSADAATQAVSMAQVTERAIVLLESIAINTDQQLERASVIIVTLKNFGRTVALSAQLSGRFVFGEQHIMIDAKEASIAPQGASEWISRALSYWMPPEEMDKINAYEAPFFYEIGVTYKDAFDTHKYVSRGKWDAALRRFIIQESVTD